MSKGNGYPYMACGVPMSKHFFNTVKPILIKLKNKKTMYFLKNNYRHKNTTPMKNNMLYFMLSAIMTMSSIVSAQNSNVLKQKVHIPFPELLIFNDQFDTYFSSKNSIEEIVPNKHFLEGPVWVDALNGLLFSDIPENKIYFWNETEGLSVWLEPSGFANGLLLDKKGDLLVMQGNYASTNETKRQIGKIINPKSNKTITDFVTDFNGKKFNSPNDIVLSPKGVLYFTDPPYGLTNADTDSLKELSFNGVYKLKNNKVELLIDSLQRPNGIGLSPDAKFLYVSDTENGNVLTYQLNKKGDIIKPVNFFDIKGITDRAASSSMPFFDGMTVSRKGVILLSGYNGIWFVSPKGVLLGHIQTPEFTSNCTLDSKEEYLYWTSGKYPFVKGSSTLYRYKL
ncbi:SMP-30/gluconolactonase/LRE family protein [Yeosuana sp.]|uniref:SMP-30/gluconolactonase/LRE family protein n=1 Tax=Yeosuana sp. TaxID=2529388 RepID=UPI004054DF71